jgi:hypothetical protein
VAAVAQAAATEPEVFARLSHRRRL